MSIMRDYSYEKDQATSYTICLLAASDELGWEEVCSMLFILLHKTFVGAGKTGFVGAGAILAPVFRS